jgi:hypothetical protein
MPAQLTVSAPFDIEDCGRGLWCLRPHDALQTAVYVSGSLPFAKLSKCEAFSIEWLDGGSAVLHLGLPAQIVTVPVASAFLHEPLTALYGALPLARLDAKTKRFWRRIFALVRLPGGQILLGWLGPRTRRAAK